MKEAGLKKVLFVFLCAAAWACPAAVAQPPNPNRFRTEEATEASYKEFIETLRELLRDSEPIHGIPVLANPATLTPSNRYMEVELANSERVIQIGIDRVNVYVVAFRSRTQAYFLSDCPRDAPLFTDATRNDLPFTGSYRDLARVGDQRREESSLGLQFLINAIESLWSHRADNRQIARSLIVIIQMVSEAVRFTPIQQRIGQSIRDYSEFRPHFGMIGLENEWGSFSENVQRSEQGTFPFPVILTNIRNQVFHVTSLAHPAVSHLAIMLFVCRQPPSPKMIRSIVEPKEEETCDLYQPTVRISGRDGMCVDLFDNNWDDGTPVILWRCKNQLVEPVSNQLWKMELYDITSRGKCLTTSGAAEGSYVMIRDCRYVVGSLSTWEVRDNGDIVNPRTGLALTAPSTGTGGRLTMEKIGYTMRQGWRSGNDTNAFLTLISGFQGNCMQAQGNDMWVVPCDYGATNQQWEIYSDGSIRPTLNTNNCLTPQDHKQGAKIVMMLCSNRWASQRWLFRRDGTIFNQFNGMVMDVKDNNPSLREVILWRVHRNSNQIWRTLF